MVNAKSMQKQVRVEVKGFVSIKLNKALPYNPTLV